MIESSLHHCLQHINQYRFYYDFIHSCSLALPLMVFSLITWQPAYQYSLVQWVGTLKLSYLNGCIIPIDYWHFTVHEYYLNLIRDYLSLWVSHKVFLIFFKCNLSIWCWNQLHFILYNYRQFLNHFLKNETIHRWVICYHDFEVWIHQSWCRILCFTHMMLVLCFSYLTLDHILERRIILIFTQESFYIHFRHSLVVVLRGCTLPIGSLLLQAFETWVFQRVRYLIPSRVFTLSRPFSHLFVFFISI